MFLAADADELHIVFGMKRLDGSLCLSGELSDQRSVLNSIVLRHRASDCDALRVHNDDSLHTLVSVDAIDSFLYFLRL